MPDFALCVGILPPIVSSSTIDRLRSGSLCSMFVNSRQIALPHMHLFVLKRSEMRANDPAVSYGLTQFRILSRLACMKRASSANNVSFRSYERRFNMLLEHVKKRMKTIRREYRRRKQAVSGCRTFRLAQGESLGSGVTFCYASFASGVQMIVVPFEDDNA